MNNSKCRHYESKRAVPKDNLDGTYTVEKIGRCNKVHMDGCKCNGYMQACDYYSDVRARHRANEDTKPLLDGVNVYIRYLPAGGYTIGWRKLIDNIRSSPKITSDQYSAESAGDFHTVGVAV